MECTFNQATPQAYQAARFIQTQVSVLAVWINNEILSSKHDTSSADMGVLLSVRSKEHTAHPPRRSATHWRGGLNYSCLWNMELRNRCCCCSMTTTRKWQGSLIGSNFGRVNRRRWKSRKSWKFEFEFQTKFWTNLLCFVLTGVFILLFRTGGVAMGAIAPHFLHLFWPKCWKNNPRWEYIKFNLHHNLI